MAKMTVAKLAEKQDATDVVIAEMRGMLKQLLKKETALKEEVHGSSPSEAAPKVIIEALSLDDVLSGKRARIEHAPEHVLRAKQMINVLLDRKQTCNFRQVARWVLKRPFFPFKDRELGMKMSTYLTTLFDSVEPGSDALIKGRRGYSERVRARHTAWAAEHGIH